MQDRVESKGSEKWARFFYIMLSILTVLTLIIIIKIKEPKLAFFSNNILGYILLSAALINVHKRKAQFIEWREDEIR